MKDFYVFPAIFNVADDGISISFPDLPGCLSCTDDMSKAFHCAKDALQLHLYCMEQDGEEIPAPSDPRNVQTEDGDMLAAIEAWMPPFRERMSNKAVNKTVSIPRWLDELSRKEKVNYSHLLQDALKKYLGVSENPAGHFVG